MAIRKLFEKVAKAIKWEHIDDNAVRENCVQDAAITEPKYAPNSIPETAYKTNSVSNRALAPSSVGASQVQNGSISPDKLTGSSKDKATLGLGNVDNTSDVNKPISSATQAALNGKEPVFSDGSLTDYFRGDKTFVRLDSTAVMAQTNSATGSLNNFTAPGIYMYHTATNLPSGAGAVGTLTVTVNAEQQRSQLLTDSTGFAWVRGYDGATWSPWRVLTHDAVPMFFGSVAEQTHASNSQERCNYVSTIARYVTNSNGQITVSRAGGYIVHSVSSGHWRERATGWGRHIRIQHNGIAVSHGMCDTPILWGESLGSWNIATMAYLTMSAGDTVDCTLSHNSNKSITADHHLWITGVG